MKTIEITEYESKDGKRFRDAEKCAQHEQEFSAVSLIMAKIPKPKVPSGKYFQHDKISLDSVKSEIWRLVVAKYGESFPHWKEWRANEVHPSSIVGRVLSDSYFGSSRSLEGAWSRLSCIDFDSGREYQQPFYANNPDKAAEAM